MRQKNDGHKAGCPLSRTSVGDKKVTSRQNLTLHTLTLLSGDMKFAGPVKAEGIMRNSDAIDYARLLGFASISDQRSDKIDFRDGLFGARLGAKVGDKNWVACDLPSASCDLSRVAPDETTD
jgi:hypothetical protein